MAHPTRPVQLLTLALCGLIGLVGAAALRAPAARAQGEVRISSPAGSVQAVVSAGAAAELQYSVTRDGVPVVETTPLGITVDGVALGSGVVLGAPTLTTFEETYATFGVHPSAVSRYTQASIPITHNGSGTAYMLEVRAFDDGLAYRYVVPGDGVRRVAGEQSSWKIPAGSTAWIFESSSDMKLKTYAGAWMPVAVDALPGVSPQGPIQGAGITLELPDHGGYAVLSEAALANYSGMRLEAVGDRTVRANFAEGAAGFALSGPIVTPWRVTVTAADLNGLVNSDLLASLSPPPDPALFADRAWIRPGRAVWRWLSSGTGTLAQERSSVDYAALMGYEYVLVDNGWETSFAQDGRTALQALTELCAYGRAKGVGIFVWKNANALAGSVGDWQNLRAFLDDVRRAGVAGVKVDYIYAETKSRVDLTLAVLRKAAERRLLVDLHGVPKPTGELRTYPNELTREAVRGLESGSPGARHDAALPFTRLILGPADYTPLAYTNNYAEQLATLVIYTSPLQVVGASRDRMLEDPATAPALDVVRAVPATWDETRVLAPSRIGDLALFARRAGERWFLAGISGDRLAPRSLDGLDLSFLGARRYAGVVLTSGASDASLERRELADVGAETALSVSLARAGGFVAMFTPLPAASRAPTTTDLAATLGAAGGGQTTLVASVRSGAGQPTGEVRFKDGAADLGAAPIDGGGRAVLGAALAPGEHALVAEYGGDSSFAPGGSPEVRVTVVAPAPERWRVFLPLVTS